MNRQSAGNDILDIYYQNGESIIEVAKYLNINYAAAWARLKVAGVVSKNKKPIRSNTLIKDYFKEIDCYHKAYFLGFIKADGYIDHNRNRFALRLQERDKVILQRFCDTLNLPQERLNTIIYSNDRKNHSENRQNNIELAITHNEFVSYFKDVKYKSILDKIPEEFCYHFIRGYFDGDGSINYRDLSKKQYTANIMGSPNDDHMLQYIKKYFPDFRQYVDDRSNLPLLQTSNKKLILDFANKVYANSLIYLPRKKEKFDMILYLESLEPQRLHVKQPSELVEDIV